MKKEPEYIEYEDGTRVELDEDDVPELTDEFFKNAKRFSDLPLELQEGLLSLKSKGRPKAVNPKRQISFRFAPDIVEHLKQEVKGYNGRVEALIRQAWLEGRL